MEVALHDSSHFKKSLQVVNLSERHGDQDQRLKEGPQDHPAVRVVVDCGGKTKGFIRKELPALDARLSVHVLALCILSRTSMYSCSCLTAVMATASSLIISSSLF